MLNSPLSTRPVIEALEARIAPATFTVTTTADSGPGSLRQAILDANVLEGADTIGFDIPGDQLQVIALTSALPTIKEQLTISTLTLFENPQLTELVRIDGTNAGPGVNGLNIEASKCVIAGVQIANFSDSGIFLNGSTNATIVRSAIFGMGNHGIHILGGGNNFVFSNQIGLHSSIPDSSGNQGDGILIENSSANSIAPPQSFDPVGINLPPWIVSGNSIIANGLFGIEIRGGEFNAVAGNEIAKNGAHAATLDKGGGIGIFDSKSASIGEAIKYFDISLLLYRYQVVGNSVSENVGHGVLIRGAQSSAQIAGNGINNNTPGDGVHIDGATNTSFGIVNYEYLSAHAGGDTMVGNTITRNGGWGIAAVNGATNISILGSKVASNSTGAILFDHASGAKIGGPNTYHWSAGTTITTTDNNDIQYGAGVGISVKNSSGIQVIGNSFAGTGIPIDLGGDGPTVNDAGDIDTGANHLQNHPTLLFANNQVTASLATDATNTAYRIQLFKFDPASGYSLLNTQDVTTGLDGQSTSVFNNISLTSGQQLFATATNLVTGETSEMSTAAAVWPRVSINPATTNEGNSGAQNLSFTVSLDSATTVPVKVGYRSADSTAKAGEDYGAVEGVLVFEPGETTKTITVPVFGDPIKETTESLFVQLMSAENGVLSPANPSVAGTIINDDGVPTISIQDVVTVEGANASATRPGYMEVQYTLTLSESSLDPVTVKLGVVGGTANVNSDYDPIDSTITFSPGATSVTKTLYIKNDSAREETETIQLQLSNPTAGTLGNANATVSILDDDTWQIQADAVQIVEGNDGQSMAVMKVRLVNSFGVTDHTHPISVDFNTENGTATAGSDYVATQGTLTFQPGEIEKTISVPILGDNTAEQNENFSVTFGKALGATLQQASQTISLLNDDPGTISVASASITEGHSGQKMLVFNVNMSVPTTSPVSVNFETQDGTALAGQDFESVAGQITFAPGETQKTISVPILGDRTAEQNEAFTLKLTGASGATIAAGTASGTILNDDPLISIESAQFLEGQPSTPGTRTVYLPVRLSQTTDIPISVDFTTSNGSAEAPSDYIATSGTLTFAAGQTLQYIELQIMGDQTYEPDETFSVKLSNPQGAQIGTDEGVVTIKSDELFISAQDVTIAEGPSGTKSLVFSVSLSQAQSSAVTVDYSTADGTATAGSDYTAVSGTLTFAPGETTKTVSVPIQGDSAQEFDETLRLLLSNASGASLATPEVHGVIINDDFPGSPVLSVSDAVVVQPDLVGSASLTFVFTLSKPSDTPISINFSTADGTASSQGDIVERPGGPPIIRSMPDYVPTSGSITFAPGETSKTVSVSVPADQGYPGDGAGVETVRLLLSSNSGGVNLESSEATGYILDSVALPQLSVHADAPALESNSATNSLRIHVGIPQAVSWPVPIQYRTANGTATSGTDYVETTGIVILAPGETDRIIEIPILNDSAVEARETVAVQFFSPVADMSEWWQTNYWGETNAYIDDDDATKLVISKGGRKATWTDSDGDLVTLVASKPILSASSFSFGYDENDVISLQQLLASNGNPGALSLSFSVKKSATGDGLVNVGEIDATGRDLTTISLPGRLGAILAGDTKLKTPAIHKLTVDSFGMDSATAQTAVTPLVSEVKGSIGSFAVKHDFTGANLVVSGGSVQSLVIGGDLEGSSTEAPSNVSIEKNLSKLKVGGDVSHANVLAGTGTQAGAHVGQVLVKGNWSASNLAVGAEAGPDGYFGTEDDIALQDTASRIARITIRGASLSGTPIGENATDHFGFVAGRIAAFQVGAQKIGLSSKWREMMIVGTASEDVTLCELAGPSRS